MQAFAPLELAVQADAQASGHQRRAVQRRVAKIKAQPNLESATMSRSVHVPYTVEQDEDGVWCAYAQLRPGVGANGEGATAEAAVADLYEALVGLIAEFGAPDELTVTVDVA
jgi:predicted RNase H-like HicB family nuclease